MLTQWQGSPVPKWFVSLYLDTHRPRSYSVTPSRYPRALVSSRKANLGNGAPEEGPLPVPKCPICNPQRADLGIGIQEPLLNLFVLKKTNAGRNTKNILGF